jgi:hypothetical protein
VKTHSRVKIHFSALKPGRECVPLAQACGLGLQPLDLLTPDADRPLLEQGPALWERAELHAADVLVYPHNYDASPESHALAEAARQLGRECLFFDTTDQDQPHHPPHGRVYRTSMRADRRGRCEFGMVPVCRDILGGIQRPVPLRQKGPMPVVGFCGYVAQTWKHFLWAARGEGGKFAGHRIRAKSIAALRHSRRVQTLFIERRLYAGGALHFRDDLVQKKKLWQEYDDNICRSDYVLCPRGAGNFSLRFFETLSAARIPLLIDTRCVLPFDDRIDWARHCVIVPESEIQSAGDRLADFHNSLSPRQFVELQQANRRLWDQMLSPVAFHKAVVDAAVGAAATVHV